MQSVALSISNDDNHYATGTSYGHLQKESWRLQDTCCHWNSSEKPSANADVKNSQGV